MDQQRALLAAFAFAGGMGLPLQALINGRLGAQLGTPFLASAAQNTVGACAALLLAVAFWPSKAALAGAAHTPIWAWCGGFLGMVYVLCGVIVAPRLGATSMMASVIAGQLLSSLALDQFGVLHARRPIDAPTLAGVALLLAGAALVLRRG
ncbi:MAG: DMT family transporter [Caulobacteraceae bacterium]